MSAAINWHYHVFCHMIVPYMQELSNLFEYYVKLQPLKFWWYACKNNIVHLINLWEVFVLSVCACIHVFMSYVSFPIFMVWQASLPEDFLFKVLFDYVLMLFYILLAFSQEDWLSPSVDLAAFNARICLIFLKNMEVLGSKNHSFCLNLFIRRYPPLFLLHHFKLT